MSKEELFKKYQEILLKTNGGADDYVVALCQISNLIKEFAEAQDQQITDLQKQLAITEKALELAVDYMFKELKLEMLNSVNEAPLHLPTKIKNFSLNFSSLLIF